MKSKEILGTRMSNGMIALTYDKSLKISLMKNKSKSLASITNHMQLDAQTLATASTVMSNIVTFPLQIIIGMGILFTQVGPSFLSGIAVIALGMIANIFIGKNYQMYVL